MICCQIYKNALLKKIIFIYVYVCLHVNVCHVCAGACRGQKRASELPRAQAAGKCGCWALEPLNYLIAHRCVLRDEALCLSV